MKRSDIGPLPAVTRPDPATLHSHIGQFQAAHRGIPGGPTICDICGSSITGIENGMHCKIRCLNCGYTRDCSDP